MADASTLFAAHQAGLLRYLFRAVGHRETARDLAQDVFVRVAQAGSIPEADAEQRAWLFRIARNLAIDHQRQQHVRGVTVDAPERARTASQDTTLEVSQALAQLDAIDRDVFLLREIVGLSYAEISCACDLTIDAVRSRIHRTRLRLRERLSAPIAEQRRLPMRST